MTARIVPRPKTGDSPLTLPLAKVEPQALAYAVRNKIYVLLYSDGESRESVQIAERPGCVWALAVHNGRLVDADKDIRYTDTGELIKERPDSVDALTVYNNRLVDASFKQIRYTGTGELIKERPGRVMALAVHNGRLVDAGNYQLILYTETDKPIKRRTSRVGALAVHNNRLVDAGAYMNVSYTKTNELINRRSASVDALAVYNGELIDSSDDRILYTETDELIFTCDEIVTALCPIPISLGESLAHRRRLK